MGRDKVVNIHGKDYVTVAGRLEDAHKDGALEAVETEVLMHDPIVVKARVSVKGHVFTGISSVSLNTLKQIEKQSPYEVAETSAVGRALGFAGYGVIDSVASADEVIKAERVSSIRPAQQSTSCAVCHAPAGRPHATGCSEAVTA